MNEIFDKIVYNHWANLRLADAVSELDKNQFSKLITSSFPSIQETMVHIVWAEVLWLERWQGKTFSPALEPGDYPDSDHIKKKFESLYKNQIRFLKKLEPGSGDQKVSYINFKGEKWTYTLSQTVEHLIVHSAYHRGQLVTLLRQSGVEPPNTDYLQFIDSQPDYKASL